MKSIVKQSSVNLTRKRIANPFSDIPFNDRLKNDNSIDLRQNHEIVDLGNGFVKVIPIDNNKKF